MCRIICILRSGRQFITGRKLRFTPGIVDQGAVCIKLRKTIYSCGPVITIVQCNFRSIAEGYFQFSRTLTGYVVKIFPILRDLCRGLFLAQIIVVRDLCQSRIILILLYSRLCISVRNLLRPFINNFFALIVKLRQVLNLRCPIVSIIQCNFRSVTECYLQIGRTFSCCIVLIIPDLLNRDRYLLHGQIIFVGNDCKCRIISILRISCHCITGRESRLCPRVVDQISISILRKILDLCRPIISFI